LPARQTCTTRLQFFPNGQKPSGKTWKPTGDTFLTAHRQESADRNSSTGKTYFSWWWADTIPDGSSWRLTSNLPKPVPVSAAVRTSCQEYETDRNPFLSMSFQAVMKKCRAVRNWILQSHQYPHSIIHICALYNMYVSTCKSQSALKSTQMIIMRLQFNHNHIPNGT